MMEEAIVRASELAAMLAQTVMLPQFCKKVGVKSTRWIVATSVVSAGLALLMLFWSHYHLMAQRVAASLGMETYQYPLPTTLSVYDVIRVASWDVYVAFWVLLSSAVGVWYMARNGPSIAPSDAPAPPPVSDQPVEP